MLSPDQINALFEILAGLFVLNHCRAVVREKTVAGVSIISVIFFTTWGVWNIFYYPMIGQWWSMIGGLSVFAANCMWIYLMFRFRYWGVVKEYFTLTVSHR